MVGLCVPFPARGGCFGVGRSETFQTLSLCRFRRVFLRQMSLSQGSATLYFLFWIYFSCGFSAVAFSLNFSIYVVGSPLACPLGRLGPLPPSLVGLFIKPGNNLVTCTDSLELC